MGQIQYSEKYFDDAFEYRHVVLPPEVAKLLPKNRLLSEALYDDRMKLWANLNGFESLKIQTQYEEMNGEPLGFNRAEGGCTMRSIDQSLISCSSEGHSTISSNRRIRLSRL